MLRDNIGAVAGILIVLAYCVLAGQSLAGFVR
jgi:hypothetical protein